MKSEDSGRRDGHGIYLSEVMQTQSLINFFWYASMTATLAITIVASLVVEFKDQDPYFVF